jgi:hypothetical protein
MRRKISGGRRPMIWSKSRDAAESLMPSHAKTFRRIPRRSAAPHSRSAVGDGHLRRSLRQQLAPAACLSPVHLPRFNSCLSRHWRVLLLQVLGRAVPTSKRSPYWLPHSVSVHSSSRPHSCPSPSPYPPSLSTPSLSPPSCPSPSRSPAFPPPSVIATCAPPSQIALPWYEPQ